MKATREAALEAAQLAASEVLIRQLVPGRVRIALAIYDKAGGRSFRGIPSYSRIVPIQSAEELADLWSAIVALLPEEESSGE